MKSAALLLAIAFAAPAGEVSTVDGETVTGAVVGLDSKAVTIDVDGKATSVPLDSALEVRFPGADGAPAAEADGIALRLKSGGRLACRQIVMKDRSVEADTVVAGGIKLPLAAVEAIRFRPADPAIEKAWEGLAASAPERDLLVVRNGDILDRLDGTISALDENTLTFLVGDTRVPIDRSKPKLFGIVLGRSPANRAEPVAELRFRNGDRLPVGSVALEGDILKTSIATGGPAEIRLAVVEAIDFGRGKIQYLSQLEPRDKQHAPYIGTAEFDSVFDVLVDRSDAGPDVPIRIDRQVFKRGLVIHSRTRLTYRLGGEFRRFVAVAGIEQLVRPNGNVTLTVSADGKELFSRAVTGADPPIPLDLDVSGKRELTIFVDFGPDWDDGDHLALGDARLIK